MKVPTFVAMDFETADHGRDSACAVGIVKVRGTSIISEACYLIRPPRREFRFTHIHGITWRHVEKQPRFREIWLRIRPYLQDADFLTAHNAAFDRGVMTACCQSARLRPPKIEFLCTVKLARETLGIRPANLRAVCERLGLPLNHHEPLSDARACAGIVIRAIEEGKVAGLAMLKGYSSGSIGKL